MKRVLVLSLDNISNVGDEILGETTNYLINKSSQDIVVDKEQLVPAIEELGVIRRFATKAIRKVASKTKGELSYRLKDIMYRVGYTPYYKRIIESCDMVIFAVGMYKYSTQDHSYVYDLVLKTAAKANKSVMISAASVETAKKEDWRSDQLTRSLNYESLKVFTTRDGADGEEKLKKEYNIRGGVDVAYVGDPALWIPDCYGRGIRDNQAREIKKVGINVIRARISKAYGGRLTEKEIIDFYKGLIKRVEEEGWEWKLFHNGMPEDDRTAKQIVKELGLPAESLIAPPKCANDLIDTITSFDVIFGARLHACLTAFAMGVPVCGFIWDNKLRYFSKSMKISNLFLEEKELTAENVTKKIKEAAALKVDRENREAYKQKTLQYIKKFIDNAE